MKKCGCLTLWSLAVMLVVGWGGNVVVAGPITYIESADGDLPSFGSLPVLAFDIGINSISGDTGFDPLDFTSFAFTVPAGTELVSGEFMLTDATGNLLGAEYQLRSGSSFFQTGALIEFLTVTSPGVSTLHSVPLAAGIYNWSSDGLGASGSLPHISDYVFLFEVQAIPSAVPEPASLTLVGLGAAGMLVGGFRRGRRHRAVQHAEI